MRQGTPAWGPDAALQHNPAAIVAQGKAQKREEVDTAANGRDGAGKDTGVLGLEVERLGECEQDVEAEARGRCAEHEVVAEPEAVAAAVADEGKAEHGGEGKDRCRADEGALGGQGDRDERGGGEGGRQLQ